MSLKLNFPHNPSEADLRAAEIVAGAFKWDCVTSAACWIAFWLLVGYVINLFVTAYL